MAKSPTMIDLFCGAGGLSTGLEMAGFEAKVGLDFDKHALATYEYNHPNATCINKDVSKVTAAELLEAAGSDDIDLIAGGPSCQGFSTHGKRLADDPRNFLFREFVRLVREVRPKFFLMENVRGLLTYSKGKFRQMIEDAFREAGYTTIAKVVCAADYGVPQLRYRVVFLGSRIDEIPLSFPTPTHGTDSSLLPLVTVGDAISDLPLLNGDLKSDIWSYSTSPENSYQRSMRKETGTTFTSHQANSLSPQAAKIAEFVGQGEGLRAVPTEFLPERFKKMRRISNGSLRRDCTTLYHRLNPEKPAYTITCYYRNIASGPFLHPYEDRSLSHREAARLMSYPDSYIFKGASHPRQIGNSVPPLMANALGMHLIDLLNMVNSNLEEAA